MMTEFNSEYCKEKHRHIDDTTKHHEERIEKLEIIVNDIRALIITIKVLTVALVTTLITAAVGIIVYIIQQSISR